MIMCGKLNHAVHSLHLYSQVLFSGLKFDSSVRLLSKSFLQLLDVVRFNC